MLYHVDFHIEYPASMSQKDFLSIWAREAEAAFGAKKAGVHTSDYYVVVVKGVMSNPEKGEKDSPLPVGSYWYQKGGEPHYTKCLSKEDCIIFLASDGKFDAQVLEKE